jgi:hypothetical protein
MVLDDTTLAIQTNQSRRLNVFDRNSGAVRRVVDFPALVGITPPALVDDFVWLTDFALRRWTSVTRWNPATDDFESMGVLPDEYVASAESDNWSYASTFRIGSLAYSPRGFVQGWSGLDEMFVLNMEGRVVDTADIPVVRRQGVPPNFREMVDIQDIPYRDVLESTSHLRQLAPRPKGGFVFTHHDHTILKLNPMPVLTAKIWVGVLSPDLKQACVDTPVPRAFDIRPMETFRGDTLFVLDRNVDETEQLRTMILVYLVSDAECDWLSTEPTG